MHKQLCSSLTMCGILTSRSLQIIEHHFPALINSDVRQIHLTTVDLIEQIIIHPLIALQSGLKPARSVGIFFGGKFTIFSFCIAVHKSIWTSNASALKLVQTNKKSKYDSFNCFSSLWYDYHPYYTVFYVSTLIQIML